jgi:hypothetical protein
MNHARPAPTGIAPSARRTRRRRLPHRHVYIKLGQRRALARAQQAMAPFQERQDAATAEAPRLHVVGA